MDRLEFAILIMDMCYEKDIEDAETLKNFSDELHNTLEMAIEEYAMDKGFSDEYESNY